MSGRIEVAFQLGESPRAGRGKGRETGPMRILVMGDFSGRSARRADVPPPGAIARPLRLDTDNFDDVLFALGPEVTLPAGDHWGRDLTIAFASLDDFHPDALYARLPSFRRLRELRGRLLNPATLSEAAAELREEMRVPTPARPVTPAPGEKDQAVENDAATFDRLLGRSKGGSSRPKGQPEVITELITRAVAPHVLPDTSYQDTYVGALDALMGVLMRAILRHPAFQALESAWRSAYQLISGLETGESLEVWLLDIGRDALQADLLGAGADVSVSRLSRVLMDFGPGSLGGEPWTLLVGNYSFGPSREDVACLAALGEIGSRAGGPFIAGADSAVLGCASLAENPSAADWSPLDPSADARWQGLRRGPFARWIGLALPRMILRLPYGAETDPIDSFGFEELVLGREHGAYLWGNPAFLCAALVGRAFVRAGWSFRPGDLLEVDDLPAHVYTEEGETRLQACAEAYISEATAESIAGRGLMPVLSYRNRNAVRLWQFRSLAEPPAGLAGAWA